MTALKLVLLGRPQILLHGEPITKLRSRKAQALLFYLAVMGQRHSREALAGLLWSDMDEDKARSNLRVEISKNLRPYLNDFLHIQKYTMAMESASNVDCDVAVFLLLVEKPQPTLQELITAVDLYRGDFLEDFNLLDALLFDQWVQAQRSYLRDKTIQSLVRIVEHCVHNRQYHQGIEYARRLLQLEPWLEKAHQQLMWQLAKSGDRTAALAQYDECRELLDRELGVEPEEETTALYEQIKSGEISTDEGYSQEETLAPPFQVPKLSEHFVGREAGMSWLRRVLAQPDDEPVVIVGMGGVGKTTLAVAISHELRETFADGVLWANVATSDPAAVLEDWARAFGYDFSRLPDVESRSAAFGGAVAEKHLLMVLDDVASEARIRPLLPHSPTITVLITSRDAEMAYRLSNRVWELKQLSSAQAGELLAEIVGGERTTNEVAAAQEICDLLQNLPLAVEMIGQRLRLFRSMALAEMADRLRDERQRLTELEGENQAVRASFAISYQALDSFEQRAFMLMGVFNGRSFTREAFVTVTEWGFYTSGDRLFALEGASLVRMGEDGRFQQHPLLADFARELLQAGKEGEGGYGRYAYHFLHFAQQNQHNYDTLRPEWDNMMAAMETAHNHELWQTVIDFAEALQDAWFARGRYSQARQGYKWASLSAQMVKNDLAQANCLRKWGLALLEQRNFSAASEHFLESNQLYKTIDNLSGIAQNSCDLARIAIEQSNYELAEQYLVESRSTRENLQDSIGIAETLHVEARMHYFRGNREETIRLGMQSLELLMINDEENRAFRILSLLASAFIEQNDLESAKSFAQQALYLSEKSHDKGDQAVILSVLSDIALRQDSLDVAQMYSKKSLELLQNMGDLGSQAMVLTLLGRIYQAQKQFVLALQEGLKSLELCQKAQFTLQMGYTLIDVARCYKKLNQLTLAKEKLQQAKEIAQSLQHPALLKLVYERIHRLNSKSR
jgi:DNA-binding SARP family transcriptional activator